MEGEQEEEEAMMETVLTLRTAGTVTVTHPLQDTASHFRQLTVMAPAMHPAMHLATPLHRPLQLPIPARMLLPLLLLQLLLQARMGRMERLRQLAMGQEGMREDSQGIRMLGGMPMEPMLLPLLLLLLHRMGGDMEGVVGGMVGVLAPVGGMEVMALVVGVMVVRRRQGGAMKGGGEEE